MLREYSVSFAKCEMHVIEIFLVVSFLAINSEVIYINDIL